MTTLIEEGVNEPASLNDATELFLSRWEDADNDSQSSGTDADKGEKPQDKTNGDATADPDGSNIVDEDDDDNLDLDGEDSSPDTDQDESDPATQLEATDDHKVTLTVDGEAKTVTVKELKRLYGQEASLTRKSQEVAQARKDAEQHGEVFTAATQRLLEAAKERYKPFEGIDWLVAAQKLEPDELSALRSEARDALMQVQFLQNTSEETLQAAREAKQADYQRRAKEALEILERDVPNWGRELYEDIGKYALSNGMPKEDFENITDASVIKMLNKAMRYDAAKAKAAAAKKTVAKASAPKRVVKPSSKQAGTLGSNQKTNDGLKRLSQSGSRDDAVAAFMERWEASADD